MNRYRDGKTEKRMKRKFPLLLAATLLVAWAIYVGALTVKIYARYNSRLGAPLDAAITRDADGNPATRSVQ